MTTIAGHLARRLREAGVRHVFGIPGGEVLAVLDACDRAGLAFHLVKHETSGGFIAEAVAQLTGTPGVLIGTLGPGVTNLVTAVADAYLDRTPMIVVTACADAGIDATYTHQLLDQSGLLKAVTKGSFTLSPTGAAPLIDRAIGLVTEGMPGPVHLNLPAMVATADVGDGAGLLAHRVPAALPSGADLATLRSWLAGAECPLILAGLGVLHHRAHEELAAFARRTGAAMITTYKAKGVVPEDEPLVIGGAGLSPVADRILLEVVRAADLILCLGYDPVEMRDSWIQPWDPSTDSVEIGWAPRDHGVHRTKLEFVANLKVALRQLLGETADRGGATWPGALPFAAKKKIQAALRPREAGKWGPHTVIETCRRLFPRETLATADTGAHRILLSHVWPCYEPYGLLQSTGLATMGFGLPAAIGAKLARPERPVLCFTGDAGLEMVLGELATLRDLHLPLTVVCFADRSLALIELKQRRMKLKNVGVDFPGTDFAAVAAALGGVGIRVASTPELEAACEAALCRHDTFTLIEAVVDKGEYAGQM